MIHTVRVVWDADIKVQDKDTHQERNDTLQGYSVTKHFNSPIKDIEEEVAKILSWWYGFQWREEVTVFVNGEEV